MADVLITTALQGVTAVKEGLTSISASADALGVSILRAGDRMEAFGTRLISVGRSLTTYVTLPMAGAAAAALKMGADFQTSMQQIVGLAGVSQDVVDGWKGQVAVIGEQYGKTAQEMARSLYFIASSGIEASKAMDVLRVSAEASAAGLGTTEVVADAVTSAVNAYASSNLTAAHAADVLVQAVREGKGEADAIAGAIGRVLPVASQLGISFDNVGASLAAMTRIGLTADEATTALRATLNTMQNETPQTAAQLKMVGLTMEGLRKEAQENLFGALTHINEAFKGNVEAMSNVFPNIRALTGVLSLVGGNAKSVAEVFEGFKDTTGSLDTAFGAIRNTFEIVFDRMKASLSSLSTILSKDLGPAFNGLVDHVNKGIGVFSQLSDGSRHAAERLALYAAAVGPALLATGLLVKSLGYLTQGVGLVVKVLAGVGAVFSPWVLGLAAVSAALYTFWDDVQRTMSGVKAWVEDKLGFVVTAFKKLKDGVNEALAKLNEWWDDMKANHPTIKRAADAVSGLKDAVKGTAEVLGEQAAEKWKPLIEKAKEFAAAGKDGFDTQKTALDNLFAEIKKLSVEWDRAHAHLQAKTKETGEHTTTTTKETVAAVEQSAGGMFDFLRRKSYDFSISSSDNFKAWGTYLGALFQKTQTMAADTWVSFSRGFGDSVAAMVVEGKNLHDSLQNLFKKLAESVISTFVQIGAQWLALKALMAAGLPISIAGSAVGGAAGGAAVGGGAAGSSFSLSGLLAAAGLYYEYSQQDTQTKTGINILEPFYNPVDTIKNVGGEVKKGVDTVKSWFGLAKGGAFVATQPTLLAVGENGPEDVYVNPMGGRGGIGGGVVVNFHGPVVYDEIGMAKFLRQLDRAAAKRRSS